MYVDISVRSEERKESAKAVPFVGVQFPSMGKRRENDVNILISMIFSLFFMDTGRRTRSIWDNRHFENNKYNSKSSRKIMRARS